MRRTVLIIGMLICALSLVATARGEEIHGKLVITRTLTKKRVLLPSYQIRGPLPHAPEPDTGAIDEWQRVVVYLEGDKAPTTEPVTVEIDQKGQQFEPETVVVPVGSIVSFPNSDPIFHNVFSLSKARHFDLGFYPAGETRLVKFRQPGVVHVYCRLHSNMNAAILVVPNAWYKRPDKHGNFAFSNLTPGTYSLVVWHKSAGFFRRKIQVRDKIVNVSVEIPLEQDARP